MGGGRMFWKNKEERESIILEANKQKGKSSFEPFSSLNNSRKSTLHLTQHKRNNYYYLSKMIGLTILKILGIQINIFNYER